MNKPAVETPAFLSKEYARLKSFGKPVQYTEFGNKSTFSNDDPDKWRLAAWVSFMNESGMLYWNMSGRKTQARPGTTGNSNAFLGPETRKAFRILNRFTRNLSVTLRPRLVEGTGRLPIEAWALGNEKTTVFYAHNRVDHAKPTPSLEVFVWTGPGTYRVKWIDPASGKLRLESRLFTQQNIAALAVPRFRVDIAARIERVA
jgi:hypothetical protein